MLREKHHGTDFDRIETMIVYKFADRGRLVQALTHASVSDTTTNNERLEFLGDRVLGLAMAELLHEKYPEEREGILSRRLHYLVSASALVGVAVDLDLGRHLIMSKDAAEAGGRETNSILADSVEAILGAMHLDHMARTGAGGGSWSQSPARSFVRTQWRDRLHQEQAKGCPDPKSKLKEYFEKAGEFEPFYSVVSKLDNGRGRITFVVEASVVVQSGVLRNLKRPNNQVQVSNWRRHTPFPKARGQGRTKKKAETDAADALLKKIMVGDNHGISHDRDEKEEGLD